MLKQVACALVLVGVVRADEPPSKGALLVSLLADNAGARRKAVSALSVHPETIPVLVDALGDDDESVAAAAAEVLADLGRKGLAEYSRFLENKDDPARASFLQKGEVLAAYGPHQRAANIHFFLGSPQRPDVRRAAAASLIVVVALNQPDELALDVLADGVADPDTQVQAMAATSLALLGWSAVVAKHPPSSEEMRIILRAVGSEEPAVRHVAICIVGLLRPTGDEFKRALGALCDDPQLNYAVRWALRQLGVEDSPKAKLPAIDDLVRRLAAIEKAPAADETDADRQQRERDSYSIADAVRQRGLEANAAAPGLSRLLARESGFLRIAIAEALLACAPARNDEAVTALIDVLRTGSDGWTRRRALDVLAELHPRAVAAIPAFVEVLGWDDPPEPEGYKDLARRSGGRGTSLWLIRRARRAAADALGAYGPDAASAKPALAALLLHDDVRLRYRAARAMRRVGK